MNNDEIERLNRYLDELNADQAPEALRIEDEETAILFRTARRLKVGGQEKAIVPDPDFSTALERQLLVIQASKLAGQWTAEKSSLRRLWTRLTQPFSQHRWATVALGILLAVTVALGVAGPHRVWAQIQRLLGYVPGVGFVSLEETRVLVAPVEVTRDGVTLRVEQVLAQPDRTVVIIRSEGLPPKDQLWPHGPMEAGDYQPELHLPDGRTLTSKEWALRLGAGTLEFPPLPDDVYRVTLELPRLPLVPPGAAPEDWAITLTLPLATGELAAELFPQPYAPPDASDTHAGVTLRVLEAAHSPEETVIRLQVQWPNPDWQFPHIGGDRLPQLQDDLGHVYRQGPPPGVGSVTQMEVERITVDTEATPTPTPAVPTYEETLAFAPVSPSAQRLTLWVDAVQFYVPAEGSFTVNLGDDPQVGDRWPLDVHLTVVGFPVHITGARLVVEEIMISFDDSEPETRLEFDIGPVPDQRDRELRGIHLDGYAAGFSGSGGGYSVTGGLRASLTLKEEEPIPTGPIRVGVESASVLFRGPWNVTWTVPGADETDKAKAAPVTLHPANASQTRAGLTLRVDEVTLTDRLTAVTVKGSSLSPDVMVGIDSPGLGGPSNWILEWHPVNRSSDGQPPDKDLQGRRYERTRETGWQPHDEQTSEVLETSEVSETLAFEPVQPLARRITLHVPAVGATLPDVAAFDAIVPAGVEMQPPSDRPWSASEPWDVDVPVEVADYQLRFTHARLEELNGTILLVLTSAPFEGQQGDQWLTSLHLASVTAPDGQAVDLRSAFSHADPDDQKNESYQLWLAFDVVDSKTGAVQPGRYHVELDGVTIAVQGPWTLTWNLHPP